MDKNHWKYTRPWHAQLIPVTPPSLISCWLSEGISISVFSFQTAAFNFSWLTTTLFCSPVSLGIHKKLDPELPQFSRALKEVLVLLGSRCSQHRLPWPFQG